MPGLEEEDVVRNVGNLLEVLVVSDRSPEEEVGSESSPSMEEVLYDLPWCAY